MTRIGYCFGIRAGKGKLMHVSSRLLLSRSLGGEEGLVGRLEPSVA